MTEESARLDSRVYRTREPVTIALLTGLAIVCIVLVAGLSRIYHNQQDSLADRWSARGAADLQGQHYTAAVADFRTALLYSRDNFQYQLDLAEALLGEQRTDEAYAYLINLWGRQPENGLVNRELARIAANRGELDKSLRYYHDAIYANWPGDEEAERRKARFELIELQLKSGSRAAAESELIALAANLGKEPAVEARVGALFARAQDNQQALAEYRQSLKDGGSGAEILAGAGQAAYALGQYGLAERYLEQAVAANPADAESARKLETARLVMRFDPFRQQLSTSERNRMVVQAFTAAGERLKTCCPAGAACTATEQSTAEDWAQLQPQITVGGLRRDPDLVNAAMALVFNIERQTASVCGAATGTDEALLLIANMHEGL